MLLRSTCKASHLLCRGTWEGGKFLRGWACCARPGLVAIAPYSLIDACEKCLACPDPPLCCRTPLSCICFVCERPGKPKPLGKIAVRPRAPWCPCSENSYIKFLPPGRVMSCCWSSYKSIALLSCLHLKFLWKFWNVCLCHKGKKKIKWAVFSYWLNSEAP